MVKLGEPTLSAVDRSWTDPGDAAWDTLAEGTPPQMPVPPSVFPDSTASLAVPAEPPIAPRRRTRDHNDSTLIVRPHRDRRPRLARRWWIAGIASAIAITGALVIALWPSKMNTPAAAAARTAPPSPPSVASAPPPPAPNVAHRPVKRVATAKKTQKPLAKPSAAKKPVTKSKLAASAKPAPSAKHSVSAKPAIVAKSRRPDR